MNQNKLNLFVNYIKKQDFKNAAKLLKLFNEQEIIDALEAIQFKVNSISLLRRQLKPNMSYNDFNKAWLPPLNSPDITSTATGVCADYFPFPVRVINGTNINDNQDIISIGLMGGTKHDIEKLKTGSTDHDKNILEMESIRHNQIEKVSHKIGKTDFFECKDDNNLG